MMAHIEIDIYLLMTFLSFTTVPSCYFITIIIDQKTMNVIAGIQ